MRVIIILLTVLALATTASANFTVDDYVRLMNDKETKDDMAMYVLGAGNGLLWANFDLQYRKERMLFCIPMGLSLNVDDFISILNKKIKHSGSLGLDVKSMYIGSQILYGLQRTFPCKKTQNKGR